MNYIRVIPKLDIKGPNLVKGVHLEGLRVLGKPWNFAYEYYKAGADELIYLDSVASLYGRNNLQDIVKKTAENIFIPLTVGGGIRSVADIKALLRAGADKVAINTAAVHNPDLIKKGAREFGSQCIVLQLDAKMIDRDYEALTDNARELSGRNVFDWVKQAVDLGAGEVLLTSVDMEGTGKGFDNDLVKRISESVPIPVIACGGAGNTEHFIDVIKNGNADAVSAASIFHYQKLSQLTDEEIEEYKDEGNIEFLKMARGELSYKSDKLTPVSIIELKNSLIDAGINCRRIK